MIPRMNDAAHRTPSRLRRAEPRPAPRAAPAEPAAAFHPIGRATESLVSHAATEATAFGARPYQVELAKGIVAALESPVCRVRPGAATQVLSSALVVVPTGGGKTHVGLSVARLLQRRAGLRVGVVAARRDLLRQAREENERFGFGVDLRLVSLFEKDPPPVDLMIFDEAHRDACASAATLAAKMCPRWVLGLTATPFRGDSARLAYSHEIRRCSIQSLQSDGYLANYEHFSIDEWRPDAVADAWLRSRERFGQSLMFFRTRREAAACLRSLQEGGARADIVDGASDRESQLEAFAAGDLDVLLAMGCLSEGISMPHLRTVFVRPASRGPTIQAVGRVFRKHPDIPLKAVVQCRRAPVPFPRIAKPMEQHVLQDGRWRSLGPTRELDAVVARMRGIAARGAVDMPTFLAKFGGRAAAPAVRGLRTGRFHP
jgi:superfamily II DNA or RNA helicase